MSQINKTTLVTLNEYTESLYYLGKTGYVLHCCCTSLLRVRDSLRQTGRHSQEKEMMTILPERREYL